MNYAFIDGQNLYMNTAKKEINSWRIDLARYRKYRSSLYKELSNNYFAYLDDTDIKSKISKR
jgi:hypothetical protein